MKSVVISAVIIVLILLGLGWLAFAPGEMEEIQEEQVATQKPSLPSLFSGTEKVEDPVEQEQSIRADEIPGVDSAFEFASIMPVEWQVEAVAATSSINLYDPDEAGTSTLEQSQIFIRSFQANDFLTLSTVTISDWADIVLNDRPAATYTIEKKADVPDFAGQPTWRSERHMVTDVRVSDTNPSVFYVIAKRPSLDRMIYQNFLDALEVIAGDKSSSLVEPIAEFEERITKKPFGVFITPETSPVQPERFTGYHTAVDVEYEDVLSDVPVLAMADGEVVRAQRASGYGGVTVIQHEISGEILQSLYGHLDPARLPSAGQDVAAGERIGVLGDGETAETDGQRKHLHFGILKGSGADIRGYVGSESELSGWYDPLEFL